MKEELSNTCVSSKNNNENDPFGPELPTHIGHRQRMKQKFLMVEPSSFTDYELMELMLFQAIPRKDVKPLAKELLSRFGSISKIVKASEEEILKVAGINENITISLKLIKEMLRRSLKQDIMHKNAISSWGMLLEYLTFTMDSLEVEEFHVLFLNKKNQLIADELMARGTIDQTPVYPREIVKKALHYSAASVILVHNHPSGSSQPSNADIDITREIENACKAVNVRVHDHVIIGAQGHYSFKSNLLL